MQAARQQLNRLEQANIHVGLRCYGPGHQENPEPGQWSASWWNGPARKAVSHPTEGELITYLSGTFGRHGATDD